jgi:hypothetical protein
LNLIREEGKTNRKDKERNKENKRKKSEMILAYLAQKIDNKRKVSAELGGGAGQ